MIITCPAREGTVYDWLIREHAFGAWRGRITVAASLGIVAGDRLTLDGLFAGTAEYVSPAGALAEVEIVGGAGGLNRATVARQYAGVAIASVLTDLCAAGGETPASTPGELGAWRSRGKMLAVELTRLSDAWRVLPDGTIALAQASTEIEAPGAFTGGRGDARTYACDTLAGVAGSVLDGVVVETAIFTRGTARPSVTVFPMRPRKTLDPDIVGGTITGLTSGRADIALDNGESLTGVPLFSSAGYVPNGASGVRCVVLDCADGANTIALCGVDGTIDDLALAGGTGRALRSGDKIFIAGLVSATPGSPVVSPTGAVVLTLDPTLAAPGDPGVGYSKVKL